ncbi:MAG: YkgJ family cysteine cluster protein [Faecalibacterium sp.]|nr:YkgJ family cysteine cluster protein [Faecalibacterium sp.]
MNQQTIDLGALADRPLEQAGALSLAPADRFEFACAGCGDCCRSREDIVLSGYDLWRIAARLQLPAAVVLHGYCSWHTGAESGLPVVRLRPLPGSKNCPFLHQSRCSIHEAAPLVCALYPLAQQIDTETGQVSYALQLTDCGGPAVRAVCADYLNLYGVGHRQPIDVEWAVECTRLSARVRALLPQLHPAQQKMLSRKVWEYLYRDLDWQQPYPPQQLQGFAAVHAYLDKVHKRITDRKTI